MIDPNATDKNRDNDDGVGPIAELFERGQKYNDHVYCIPEDDDAGGGGSTGGNGGTLQ